MRTKKPVDSLDQVIGRNIRFYRVQKGLSQTVLGESIGVTFQQVQKYETASNRVPASRLARIASVLDVPINLFVCDGSEAIIEEGQSGFSLHERFVLLIDFNILSILICRNVSER